MPRRPTPNPLRDLAPEPAPAPENGRRDFVRKLALGAGAVATLPLAACGGGGSGGLPVGFLPPAPAPAPAPDPVAVRFDHGVASGDPLADRVILWTRVSPPEGHADAVAVAWELARDEAFADIVARGEASATAEGHYTVKVDAAGLAPATGYHYRFSANGVASPLGRTRTLPTGSVSQVRMAVFSCANYPAGFFNAYAHAAQRGDLDVTVHLGDYIYEYEQDGYASANAAALGRLSLPETELLSLADYRQRHAQYRSDPDLQALHAAAPMIAVWDDHEISNDTWTEGAQNHQPATEGLFAARKAAALQAYHEWLPTRVEQPDRIYRSFAFGDLMALHMLDTRVVGRDQQLDYARYFQPGGFDATTFTADMANPARQLLGGTQTQWLQQQMAGSQATWQVLGQQVLMGRMSIPAPILADALNPGSGVSASQYAALAARGQTAPGSLTPTEQAILAQPAIPYNLDAWDGYAVARETVLGMSRAMGKNLVVLAGDTHNAWASELQDITGHPVGVEFATSSVSSPGFEVYLPNEAPETLASNFQQLIPTLKYCDTSRRGYMVVTATAAECRAEWVYVDTIGSRTYTASTDATLRVLPGAANVGRLVA